MPPEHPREQREQRERQTIRAMFRIYCHDRHGSADQKMCPACQELENYALARLARCPFQENKPACAKCSVHCYKPDMRQQVRQVMRHAGPKMLLHHPILALRHLLDERRPAPEVGHKKLNHRGTEKKL